MQVLQPKGWKQPRGYVNGISAEGRLVFVAGQVGWDETETFQSSDLADQIRQALRNTMAVLAEAGARAEHVARMTWYITDKNEYLTNLRKIGEAYREVMGRHYPVMAMVQVAGLVEDGAKVEIESTAVIPPGSGTR